jgi:hypothetical protein
MSIEATQTRKSWKFVNFDSSSSPGLNKKTVEEAHLCLACQSFLSGTTKATRFGRPKEYVVRQFLAIEMSAEEDCHICARYVDSLSESSRIRLRKSGEIHVYALSTSDTEFDGYQTNKSTGLSEPRKMDFTEAYTNYKTLLVELPEELGKHMEDETVNLYPRDIHFDPFPGSRSEDRGFRLFKKGIPSKSDS